MKLLLTTLIFLSIPTQVLACKNTSYLNNTAWTNLQKLMRSNTTSINRRKTTRSEVIGILGTPSICKIKSRSLEECIWQEGEKCEKKVTALFNYQELSKIKKKGF